MNNEKLTKRVRELEAKQAVLLERIPLREQLALALNDLAITLPTGAVVEVCDLSLEHQGPNGGVSSQVVFAAPDGKVLVANIYADDRVQKVYGAYHPDQVPIHVEALRPY